MINTYFKIAFRTLLAYRSNTLINIIGLVTGIASALVLFTLIRYELSFDSFHSKANEIYRLVRNTSMDGTASLEYRTGVSYPVPNALKDEIPAIQDIVSLEYVGDCQVDIMDDKGTTVNKFNEGTGCVIVQNDFFKIFDFNGVGLTWLAGNPSTALKDPYNVVLTESLAKKYFPGSDALGKTLKLARFIDVKVTGVIKDFPNNTDFPFTIMISYPTLKELAGDSMNDWFSVNDSHQTFILVKPGVKEEELEKQIHKVHAAHTPKHLSDSRFYVLQKLGDVHFESHYGNFNNRTISRETVLGLAIVALFLLLTASINYVNLATAQTTMRAREIGLRKVMGSNRINLVLQFLAETFITVLTAGIVAWGLAHLLIMNLQDLLNMRVNDYQLIDTFTLLTLLIIVIVVTLFSGLYPSLVISKFNPATTLRNKFSSEKLSGISLRKILVVAQFTITQMFVVGTFVVISQMKFFHSQDLGFQKDAIINIRIPDNNPLKVQRISDALKSESFVSAVSFSSTLPSGASRSSSHSGISKKGFNDPKDIVGFEYQSVDPEYIDVYKIKLLHGRKLTASDTVKNIIINEQLAKSLGYINSFEAIDQELSFNGTMVTVVGIVKDFHIKSLRDPIGDVAFFVNPKRYSAGSIKLSSTSNDLSSVDVIKKIEKVWNEVFPEYIFEYKYFDENVNALYSQENKYAQLFQIFSIIFLVIGCLGLYGLIAFVVNRKLKEVAIRKVHGASLSNILLLFSQEYVKLIIISFFIAAPVTYYFTNEWLSNFANAIQLHVWMFIIPGALVLLIATLVVSSKSIQAANANPAKVLKME